MDRFGVLRRPLLINLFEDALGILDRVSDGALSRRAWLDTYFVEFPCCKNRCGKKDCVFPLLILLSPPAETGPAG